MASRWWIALLITLMVGGSVFGMWVPIQSFSSPTACQIAVQPAANGGWQLDVSLPGLQADSYDKAGQTYQSLRLPGENKYDDEEATSLPVLSRYVGLTRDGNPELEVLSEEWTDLPGTYVLDVTRDAADAQKTGGASEDEFGPTASYRMSPRQVMGGVPLALLTINAVKYNPNQHKIRALQRATFVIHESGSPERPRAITETTARILEPMLANWDQLNYRNLVVRGTILYIVAQDALLTNDLFQRLVAWRWKQGYKVEAVGPGTITAWNATGIRNYVKSRFQAANPPLEFVGLFGDADDGSNFLIPCFITSYYSGASDFDYSRMDDNDFLPDVAVGRFCFSTEDELRLQINRGLRYETTPSSPSGGFSKPNWYHGAGLFGDPTSSGISTIQTMKTVREDLMNIGYPSSSIDTVYAASNWTTAIETSINSGVGVWCYRGWWYMSNYIVNAANLTNTAQWPFIMNLTCGTNDYNSSSDRYCEDLMLCGTISQPKGPIGIIGMSTTGTHTRFNNALMMGGMQGFTTEGIHSQGGILWRSRLEVERNFAWSDSAGGLMEFFEAITNLLGDPALDVFTDAPDTFAMTLPATLPAGTDFLNVIVKKRDNTPVPGAYVNLLKGTTPNPQVFVGGWTDAAGQITLNFLASTAAESLYVTATKHNFRPFFGGVAIVSNSSLVAPASATLTLNDDNIGSSHGNSDGRANPAETIELPIPLKNWGTAAVNGVTGILSTSDPYIAAISDNSETYGTIAAGATVNSSDDFDFVVGSYVPNGHVAHFTLQVSDNASHNWTNDIPVTLANGDLECDSIQLAGVGGNGVLDPGETGQITFFLKNVGLLTTPAGLTGYLNTASSALMIGDNVGIFPAAGVPGTTSNQANTFGVTATTDAYPGQQIPLTLIFPLASGFCDTIHYTITVGVVAADAPSPPDAYGYWAFDDQDVAYAKHPPSADADSSWVECDPRFGGSGTRVPILDDDNEHDATGVVNLPFSFRYYGHDYNQIAVCSNGWLAMGAAEAAHTDFRNYRIPSAAGPSAMIAPFWDDLRITYGGAVQEAVHPPVFKEADVQTFKISDALSVKNPLPEIQPTTAPEPNGRRSLDAGSDYCTGIPVIASLPYTDTGNTSAMANDWTTSSCPIGGAPDVFYSYTPGVTALVRVSLCGSDYDTGLMIRSGGACPGSAEVTCNDDYSGCSNTRNSQVDVTLNAGVTYYIIVDGWSNSVGNYALSVTSLGNPPNQCANAAVIPSLPYTSSGSTSGHWNTYGYAAPDTFYKYTVPAGGDSLLITTCGSSFDTYLRVWRPCGSTQLAADDNSCDGSSTSKIVDFFTSGDIWIQVEGTGSYSGNYTLNVSHYVAPQICQNAAVIAALPYMSSGSTVGHQNMFGWASPDTFYKYTVQAPGETLDINLCGSNFDTYLRIWRPCGGTQIAADDDACGSLTSRLFQYFTAGDLWIHVEGYQSNAGDYTLNVSHYTPPLPGAVCTYHDAANHRFIVEWSHAGKYSGSENLTEETFECVLYQPGYPATPTGDGEILFQYKTILNTADVSSSNNYCTVGIENPEKTDGVLYSYWNQSSPMIPGAEPLVSGRAILFTTAQYSASAPLAPENLTLLPIGTDMRLIWSKVRQDQRGVPVTGVQYNIYAGTTASFAIEPASLIASVSDTFYVDSGPNDVLKFYAVQAATGANLMSTAPGDHPSTLSKATYQQKGPIRTTPNIAR